MHGLLSLLAGALLASQACAAPAPVPGDAPPAVPPAAAPPAVPAAATPAAAPPTTPLKIVDMPKTPGDPAPGKGETAGKWGSKTPGAPAYDSQDFWNGQVPVAWNNQLGNTGTLLQHYLQNTGQPVVVDPQRVSSLIEGFQLLKDNINFDVIDQGLAITGHDPDSTKPFTQAFHTDWRALDPPKGTDFGTALQNFKYAITGRVFKYGPDNARLEYQVHIFDRYYWKKGIITVNGIPFNGTALGELQLYGLAKEYVLKGSTAVCAIEGLTNQSLPPPPPGRKPISSPKPKPPPKKDPAADDYKTKGCKTTGNLLNHRNGPRRSAMSYGMYPKGKLVKFQCFENGENIKGDWTTNNWGKADNGHFLSLAYIDHKCASYIPPCKKPKA